MVKQHLNRTRTIVRSTPSATGPRRGVIRSRNRSGTTTSTPVARKFLADHSEVLLLSRHLRSTARRYDVPELELLLAETVIHLGQGVLNPC